MKKLPQLIGAASVAALVMTATSLSGQEVTLEEFLFDDSVGTPLSGVSNTGTQGSEWRFGGWETDGAGNLAFDSGQGTATRKLPERGTSNAIDASNDIYRLDLQHNTGVFRLEIDFDVDFTANTAGDNISWGLNDAEGDRLVRFSIRENSGNTQVQFSANNDDGTAPNNQFRTADIGSNNQRYDNQSATIIFDFDNNTVDYLLNGSSILPSLLDFDLDGTTEIGQFIGSSSGTWGTGGTNAFNLDTIRLVQVPEPSAFALLAGCLALTSIALRRRK